MIRRRNVLARGWHRAWDTVYARWSVSRPDMLKRMPYLRLEVMQEEQS